MTRKKRKIIKDMIETAKKIWDIKVKENRYPHVDIGFETFKPFIRRNAELLDISSNVAYEKDFESGLRKLFFTFWGVIPIKLKKIPKNFVTIHRDDYIVEFDYRGNVGRTGINVFVRGAEIPLAKVNTHMKGIIVVFYYIHMNGNVSFYVVAKNPPKKRAFHHNNNKKKKSVRVSWIGFNDTANNSW